ncbi:MAG: SRPBCC family protein [Candidatus Acidiferrales bacterium]|jgi:uncharacterized protein YndB with AHSA1/START domain
MSVARDSHGFGGGACTGIGRFVDGLFEASDTAYPLTAGSQTRNVDVFVHNEGWIDAPPEIVWANLIDAGQWPSWYSNSADIRIEGGQSKPAKGISFSWKTFGFSIRSTVDVFEPNREIGWSGDSPSFKVQHAWVLVPERGGTRVITEETQKGADAIKFRLEQPNAMYDGHDWRMSALKARSERMAHREKTPAE